MAALGSPQTVVAGTGSLTRAEIRSGGPASNSRGNRQVGKGESGDNERPSLLHRRHD